MLLKCAALIQYICTFAVDCKHNIQVRWVISIFGLVFLPSGIAMCTHRPQGVVCGYLHVLKYLLFIIIKHKQKGVMQTLYNSFADV